MTTQEIIRALRRLQVETGSLACLGCAHENSCSTKGCAILRQAAAALEQQSLELEGMRSAANSLKMHLEKVTAERDAAVSDLKEMCDCDYCANDCVNIEEDCCEFCGVESCSCRGCIGGGNWTWRGLQKEG